MNVPFGDLESQYQCIKQEIDLAISNVIKDADFIGGKYVKKFENEFEKCCGVPYCIGVGNGTDAIYIALRAIGIGEGDEVITVANSFVGTSEAITMTGARVIFIDCDEETYNISLEKVADAITSKTKAIVPVDLYGYPSDIPALMELAGKHGLYVVEDAAQAHGAEIDGKRVGSLGHVACFSFYPGKNLGAYGDAGAIVTDDEILASKARMIANHGRLEKYNHEFEGINSRLDGIQAAILSVKLRHLEEWNEMRRSLASRYNELLDASGAITPIEKPGYRHVYHLYVVRVRRRDEVRAKLQEKGIATGIHYPIALPNLKAYEYLGYKPHDFPIATKYSKEILSLPMYPELKEEHLAYVCEQLKIAIQS